MPNASILILVALSTLTLHACGSDRRTGTVVPATCSGTGCECLVSSCTCTAGGDCGITCGTSPCSLVCDDTTKCNAHGDATVTLTCSEDAECKGHGGPGSEIDCNTSSKCELKADADSTATCRNDSACKLNLGPNSEVSCQDSADCDIKCDAGCRVTCATSATCKVTCGDADSSVDATVCTDGTLVCGSC